MFDKLHFDKIFSLFILENRKLLGSISSEIDHPVPPSFTKQRHKYYIDLQTDFNKNNCGKISTTFNQKGEQDKEAFCDQEEDES